jgi:hypothetical protein
MAEYEQLRRYFTDTELAAMHEQLVVEVGSVKELRSQKTQANTAINASIKGTEKNVFDLQEKLSTGYEVIDVEVVWLMDTPAPGQKTVIRVDSSEKLRVEPMTLRERQQSFGFSEPGSEG